MNLYHKKQNSSTITPLNSFNEYFCAKEQYRRFEIKSLSVVGLSCLEQDNMDELEKRIVLFEKENGTPICH